MPTINETLAEIQGIIEKSNAVSIDANVEDFHAELSLGQLRRVLGDPEFVGMGLCFKEPGHPQYGRDAHIWLHPTIRRRLEQHSPMVEGVTPQSIESAATAIEEVSHWVYEQRHKDVFGRYSHAAAAEFMGAYDKYNILYHFFHKINEQRVTEEGEEMIRRYSFEEHYRQPGERTPTYTLAHKFALAFVEYCNTLPPKEAAQLGVRAHRAEDKELYGMLLNDLGLGVDASSAEEQQILLQTLIAMGVEV